MQSRVGSRPRTVAVRWRRPTPSRSGSSSQTRNAAEATAVADAVSNPKSSSYKHYLTAAQYRARFAPTQASLDAVKKWLRAQGLIVGYVPDNQLYISALGDAAHVSKAFGVHLSKYAVQGKVLRAPDTTASVPAELAGVISGVVGLDESGAAHQARTRSSTRDPKAPPSPGFRNAPPCSAYWAEKLATDQPPLGRRLSRRAAVGSMRTDAAAASLCVRHRGRGRARRRRSRRAGRHRRCLRVADDLRRRSRVLGSQRPRRTCSRLRSSRRSSCPASIKNRTATVALAGWYGEETLDVEAVHAMAPGASIVYAGAKSCFDHVIDVALNKLVDHELVDLVSNSYGNLGEDINPDTVKEFEAIANQAAAQGIGLYFSSGDSGDEQTNLGFPATDFSASSSHVTAVGGTSLGVGADGKTVVEQGWSSTSVCAEPRRCLGRQAARRLPVRRGWRYEPSVPRAGLPEGCRSHGPRQGLVEQARPGGARHLDGRRPEHRNARSARRRRSPTARTTTSTASAARASRRRCSPA